MGRILILVEGQTEERFVKDILNPVFNRGELFLIPTIITTKVVKTGPNFKGGVNSYNNVKKDMKMLLQDSDVLAVTTMIDYYGLPSDFPSWSNSGTCYDRVKAAEYAFAQDINHEKFIPFMQLHEFEGLLFSVPDIISDTIDRSKKSAIQAIRAKFSSPEEINQGEKTHPSKRLLDLFPNYRKPLYGSLIAHRIGLDIVRENCPHFNEWLSRLLAIASN